MPKKLSQHSHHSGLNSPTPTVRQPNTKPSPATSILNTPPGPGHEAFSFINAENKTLGRTPEGLHLVPLMGPQGRSHHHVRSRDNKSIICSATELYSTSGATISAKETMWLKLLAQLTDLKKRFDQDYHRKRKDKDMDRSHLLAAKIKISTCITLLEQCLLDETDKTQRITTLNKSLLEGRIYNPYVIKNIYGENDFHLNLAKKFLRDDVQTLPLSMIKQPGGSKRSRDTDGDSLENNPDSVVLEAKKPRQNSLTSSALFKPRSVTIAKQNASPTEVDKINMKLCF